MFDSFASHEDPPSAPIGIQLRQRFVADPAAVSITSADSPADFLDGALFAAAAMIS
jgi:hypothetical protein